MPAAAGISAASWWKRWNGVQAAVGDGAPAEAAVLERPVGVGQAAPDEPDRGVAGLVGEPLERAFWDDRVVVRAGRGSRHWPQPRRRCTRRRSSGSPAASGPWREAPMR